MPVNPFYHQLPVRSPVSLRALARAVHHRNDAGALRSLHELLRREYDAAEVVLTGSGTQALQLAIGAAAHRTRTSMPRLALPAFTCFDVATAAVWSELPLLFYDIDPETLAPDLRSFEGALAEGARVVVVNALYGMPVPWEPVARLAARYGAVLIEDAAQGQGARWEGRRLGSLGELSVLSFGRGKGWTGGRGGALLLRGAHAIPDHDVAVRAIEPPQGSALAATAAQWALGRPGIYGLPASMPWLGLGETRYHEPAPPSGMPASSAVLALASHAAAEREALERRRRALNLAQRIDRRLARVAGIGFEATAQVPDVAPPPTRPPADAEPGFLRLPVRVTDAKRAVVALSRWGVAPGYPIPIPELGPVRSRLAGGHRRWPGAETLIRELITLPTHGAVNDRDIEYILRGLSKL